MAALFASGLVADLILAFMAVEAVVLFLWHRRTGRGLTPVALVLALLAGTFLVLALRGALVGAWWGWVAAALLAALLAHLADMMRRWHG